MSLLSEGYWSSAQRLALSQAPFVQVLPEDAHAEKALRGDTGGSLYQGDSLIQGTEVQNPSVSVTFSTWHLPELRLEFSSSVS